MNLYHQSYENALMRREQQLATAMQRQRMIDLIAGTESEQSGDARFRLMYHVRHYCFRLAPRLAHRLFL